MNEGLEGARFRGQSPIEFHPGLSNKLGIELYVKRDDRIGGWLGGSKVRIVSSILKQAERRGLVYDALVTTGGVDSNLARVVALAAANGGKKCDLVLHDQGPASEANLRLLRMLGARVEVVSAGEVAASIERVLSGHEQAGIRSLFVPGGGYCVEGALGYSEAASEYLQQARECALNADYIIIASGTGGTQAGLACGLLAEGADEIRLIGVSVARENPRGRVAVEGLAAKLAGQLGIEPPTIEFRDDWIMGGYGRSGKVVEEVILMAARHGLMLDPTYTGKAFLGLLEMIRGGVIRKASRVVFWHTGGGINLFNYLRGTRS